MKATLTLLAAIAPLALFTSCAPQQGQVGSPVAPAANTGNPYGVPTAPNNGGYVPEAAPYQPVPDVNIPATPPPRTTTYSAPAPAPSSSSSDLNGNVYTIKSGDSLWGLSRKFNTTVDALKDANGLANDTIIEGRTLIIPGR